MATAAEVTVICIDNSEWVSVRRGLRKAQLEAIKLYCRTKLKCNSENTVGLFTMADGQHGRLLSPTHSLEKILSCLQKGFRYKGETEFSSAIVGACYLLSKSPPHMKRRLLMFVGGPINLDIGDVNPKATNLKHCGAALDVVNFFSLDIDYESCAHYGLLTSEYRYAKKELDALVTVVNDNDNSNIVHVADESSVVEILSNSSILKKNIHYIEKKAAADAEHVEASRIQFVKPESKNKSVADDEYVQAPGTEYGERYPAKKTPHIDFKIRGDLSCCRICKHVLEPSRNEKKPKEKVLELSHNRFQPLQNLGNIFPM